MKKNRFLLAALCLVLACALCLFSYHLGRQGGARPALRPRAVDGVDVRTGPNSVTGAFYTHQLTCYVFSCRPDDGYVTVSSGAYGDAAARLPLEYFSPTTLSGVEFFPEDLRFGDKLLVSCALDDAQADVLSLRLLPGGITLDDTDRAS